LTNLEPLHGEPASGIADRERWLQALLAALPAAGVAVLNADDQRVARLSSGADVRVIRYGLDRPADVWVENLLGHGVHGMVFDLVAERRRVHVRLPLIGLHSVHGALAAAAVGLAEGLDLAEVGAGLQGAWSQTRIIAAIGLNGSRVIDDSYNASPESTLEALNLLARLDGRKIAVLGDMLGLDPNEAAGHRKVGNRAAGVVDELVTVGERTALVADEARRMGLAAAAVAETRTPEEAVEHLRRRLRPGDNLLVKGARELGLDRIVRAIRLEG
jgi:UDP-N-acetylmuramoyl-tripeptide--D-alanyl-D-alanine ligase